MSQINLKELEKLSQEDLLLIASQVTDLKRARRQKKLDFYLRNAHPSQIQFHKATQRIRYIFAGNRCLRGDQRVITIDGPLAISQITRQTKYLSRRPDGSFGYSLGSVPFQKTADDLFLVRHEHGEFVASGSHRVFCADYTYRSVRDLDCETFLFHTTEKAVSSSPLQTNWGISLSGLRRDVLHLIEKGANFLVRCLDGSRRCDQQPRAAEDSDQAFAPSLSDVQGSGREVFSSQVSDNRGAQGELSQGHNHPDQPSFRPSNSLKVLPEEPSYFVEDPIVPESHEHSAACSQASPQSLGLLVSRLKSPQSSAQEQDLFFSPWRLAPSVSRLIEIRKIATEPVWDVTIQATHNYVTEDGTVHENSGKSTAGMAELIWRCMGTHPFQKVKIPIKSCVILIDFENACKSVFEPKLTEWAPEGSIKKLERHQGGAIKRIYWTSGSITDVYSHDQAISVFEGSDYDLAWFDEPPPKMIFNAVWRGMTDRGGMMYLTGTPLTAPWLFDEWKKVTEQKDPLRWAIQFHSKENASNLGEGNRELGLKRLEEFASMLSPEERAARLEGGFIQMQGLIFKTWNRGTHVIRQFPIPVQWEIIESIDPHPAKPWAITWTAKASNGSKILLSSLYADGTIDDIATSIVMGREQLEIKDGLRPRIAKTLIDNASSVPLWQRSNTDPTSRRLSVREELENMIGPRGAGGPRVTCAPKNVAGKIDLFKRWLTVKERRGQVRADFYVFDNEDNEGFIREIEMYQWAKFKARDRQDEARGSPVKKHDDLIDSVLQVALTEGEEPESPVEGSLDMTQGFQGYGQRAAST